MAEPLFEGRGLVVAVIALLVNTAVIYLAARLVIDRSSVFAAIATALLGTFLAALVASAVPGILGIVLAAAVWALVAAFFFRATWVKGAIIGLVAWLLWALIDFVVRAIR